HIVTMPAGYDDQVAVLADFEPGKDLFVLRRVNFTGLREAFAIGEGLAIVHYDCVESGQCGDFGQALRNVPRAEDERTRNRQHGLHEDVELAAADQAIIVGGVLTQVESEMLWFFRGDDLPSRVPDVG